MMDAQVSTTSTVGRTRSNEELGTFSERFPVLYEPTGRLHKAAKILAVLHRQLGAAVEEATLLEVGSSTCIMAAAFARVCRRVVAFDLDHVALRAGVELARDDSDISGKMEFLVGDGTHMPIADCAVDIVICNQVYEHVDDQAGLLAEIYRVLRPGGVCYFGIGTRHVLIEGHYKLPCLSWIPPRLADVYVKLRGRNLRYDVTLLSYRKLKKLVRQFTVFDYTVDIIRRPEAYEAGEVMQGFRWCSRIGFGVWQRLRPLLPVHVWVLQKPPAGEPEQTIMVRS